MLKGHVCVRKPTNLSEFYQLCQGQISSLDYARLVDGYQNHLVEVQLAEKHLIKYLCGFMYTFDPVWIR